MKAAPATDRDLRIEAEAWRDRIDVAGRNIAALDASDTVKVARARSWHGRPLEGQSKTLAETTKDAIDRLFADFLAVRNITDEALEASQRIDRRTRAEMILRGDCLPARATDAQEPAATGLLSSGWAGQKRSLEDVMATMTSEFAAANAAVATLKRALEEDAPSVAALRIEGKSLKPFMDETGRTVLDALKSLEADPVAFGSALGPLKRAIEGARAARSAPAADARPPTETIDRRPDRPPAAATAETETRPAAPPVEAAIFDEIAGRQERLKGLADPTDLPDWLERLRAAARAGNGHAAEIGLARWDIAFQIATADAVWAELDGYLTALRAKARTLPGREQLDLTFLKETAKNAVAARSDPGHARTAVKAFDAALRDAGERTTRTATRS